MSLKTSLAVATTAIGLTILASPAQASRLYSFSYTVQSGQVLSGTLTGTAAGNVITVTGYNDDLTYGGTLLGWGTQTYVDALTEIYSDPPVPGPAQLSFDGTVLNFIAGNTSDFGEYYFGFGDVGAGLNFYLFSDVGGSPVDVTETFTTLNWQLQLIPEPGSVVALLGLGLGALASKVRKKG